MQFATFTLFSAISAATATVHSITVGDGALAFSPANISAAVGDTVVFSFYPSKHSVAQASFAKPCIPINDTGFFSGAIATTSGVNENTFTITINNTTPIWFYCSVASHCESGMVGAINAATTGNKTIDAYIMAAKAATNTTIPATVQGGTISSSSSSNSSSPPSPSSSSMNSSSNSTKSAGVETRGSIQWTTLAFTAVMAVAFGGLIV